MDCVRYQLPCLVSQRPIGLVVLDSVASPFRAEENNIENKNLLYTLGYHLHQLAATYNIAIVAINQVGILSTMCMEINYVKVYYLLSF